jgi:diacylglycerol kinase (ATP)
MKDFLFLINPTAGKVKSSKLKSQIINLINAYEYTYDIFLTQYPMHAAEICQGNLDYKYLIIAGGDGTLNEIVNGLSPNKDIIVGVLPLGTGNDFSKNLNLEGSIENNLKMIFDEKYNIKNVDIGVVEYKEEHDISFKQCNFINAAGIGFDSYVAYLNQKYKVFSGIISYIIAVLKALLNYKPMKTKIKFNELVLEDENLLITIGNGISSGGGFYLTKNAIIDDNLLDVCIVEFLGRFKILNKMPLVMLNKIDKLKEAKLYKTSNIKIEIEEPYYLHTDGESPSNKVKEIKFSILKDKLKFICKN